MSIIAHHGILEILRSDNDPHYASKNFSKFAKSYRFNHLTCSPRFPQSNGQVERMVQKINRLLKHAVDLHLAVLSYRATPMLWCGLSPSELCMGRRIRTTIPLVMKQLIPSWSYLPEFKKDSLKFKEKQKEDFDCRHGAKEQSEIPDGSEVVVTTDRQNVPGRVLQPACTPRFHIVETPSGDIRRNHSQLNIVPEPIATPNAIQDSSEVTDFCPTFVQVEPKRITTRSMTGMKASPPDYLRGEMW